MSGVKAGEVRRWSEHWSPLLGPSICRQEQGQEVELEAGAKPSAVFSGGGENAYLCVFRQMEEERWL